MIHSDYYWYKVLKVMVRSLNFNWKQLEASKQEEQKEVYQI